MQIAESKYLNIFIFLFTFNMHVNYKIGSRMVLWSVSTALSVCQFEEVPAVGPYVWEREQEYEESILHHVLSHSPCSVS